VGVRVHVGYECAVPWAVKVEIHILEFDVNNAVTEHPTIQAAGPLQYVAVNDLLGDIKNAEYYVL
jgi:hypothetical protein